MKSRVLNITVIFFAAAYILISSCLALRGSRYTGDTVTVGMDCLWSDEAALEDGVWRTASSTAAEGGPVILIRGPGLTLPKGSYTVNILYSSSQTDACKVCSVSDPDAVYSSNVRMEPYLTGFSFDLELIRDVSDLEFQIVYTGGELELTGISITPNNNLSRKAVMTADLIVLLAASLFLLRGKIRADLPGTAVILGATLLMSLPLLLPDMSQGHDFNFHAMRIDGIAGELTRGQFPVRMSSLWLGGYGYPVSVFYGDILLYLPAVLRIFGFSINAAFKIYVLMINVLSCSISYICFRKIFTRPVTACITTLIYATAAFRFVDCYVRTTAGEMAAFIFLPVVALGIFRIYTDDIREKDYIRNCLILAAGMSGLIITHLITAELTCFILIAVVLILWKKTFRKETFFVFIYAVAATLLITAAFLIPFLHYSASVVTNIKVWMMYDNARHIQSTGASPFELIRFWGSWFGKGNDAEQRMMLSPGLLLLTGLVLSLVVIIRRKGSRALMLVTGLSLYVLLLCSNIFPWDILEDLPLGKTFVAIQFPWRYLAHATILITIATGMALEKILPGNRKITGILLTAVSVTAAATAVIFAFHYAGEAYMSHFVDTHSLQLDKVEDAEYIPADTDLQSLNYDIVTSSGEGEIVYRNGTDMTIRTVSDTPVTVSVPVFAYPGYVTGNGTPVYPGENHMITMDLPAGDITTEIHYRVPFFYRISDAVSLISVAGAVYLYNAKSRKGKNSI